MELPQPEKKATVPSTLAMLTAVGDNEEIRETSVELLPL